MANDKGQGGPATPKPNGHPNGPARARWLIWSREHTAFRLPDQVGYTVNLDEAGRYTTKQAKQIIATPGRQGFLQAVLAPECAPAAVLLESLSENTQLALTAFLATTHAGEPGAPAFNSHGALDLAKLVAMLLQDVALMIQRPGSWEGANMMQVMASHGYDRHQDDPICEAARRRFWGGKDPYANGRGNLK